MARKIPKSQAGDGEDMLVEMLDPSGVPSVILETEEDGFAFEFDFEGSLEQDDE